MQEKTEEPREGDMGDRTGSEPGEKR